jgi:hypothetical protein
MRRTSIILLLAVSVLIGFVSYAHMDNVAWSELIASGECTQEESISAGSMPNAPNKRIFGCKDGSTHQR